MSEAIPQKLSASNFFGLIGKCPACGNSEKGLEVSVLGDYGETRLIYLSCKKCGDNLCAIISPAPFGVNVVSFGTSLNREEIIKFMESGTVSADDVLDLHDNLKQKNFI